MKEEILVLSVILVCTLALGAVPSVLAAAKTPKVQIHIYLHPDVENADLQAGVLDINDWPLAKEWVDAWALMPDQVVLRDYVELGMMEIDINCQKWPTGDNSPNKFYDASLTDNMSVEFRKAIACLIDRDKIVRDILGSFGFRMDVPLPPFQSDFIDMANYTVSGLIYNYNKTRAEVILNAAGFTQDPVIRRDPVLGNLLRPLMFYIRNDDPNRKLVGEMLTEELRSVGIPVCPLFAPRNICYRAVMISYDYHLYTGGWSLTTIPDQYYDLYSSFTYYGPSNSPSQNYPGFCNHQFDDWAAKVKYPETVADARAAAKVCGYIFLKYCAVIPLYCTKSFKAYRTGWTGVVNDAGFGVDNYWSFLNMEKNLDDTIDWGFKSDIQQLNVISSQWLWDWSVLGLMYESMMGTNPFNLAPTEWFLAYNYTVGTWAGPSGTATVVTFLLRDNATFHNTTVLSRKPFTANDVAFSFKFQHDCGPGVAWNYPSLAQWNKTVINSPYSISVYYNKKSAWAAQWASGLPIMNNETWGNLEPGMAVKKYDPVRQDLNNNTVKDIMEDGTGAWMFQEYASGSYVKLVRDDNYYLDSITIENRLKEMFHVGAGDINRDLVVNVLDLALLVRALGTNSGMTHGTGWVEYNPDCDLNGDGRVDGLDSVQVIFNYGRTMG